jgi:hypothetical protein
VQISAAIIQQRKRVTLPPPQTVITLEVHLRQFITLLTGKPQLRFLHPWRHYSTMPFQNSLGGSRGDSDTAALQRFGYLGSTPGSLITQPQYCCFHRRSYPLG